MTIDPLAYVGVIVLTGIIWFRVGWVIGKRTGIVDGLMQAKKAVAEVAAAHHILEQENKE